MDKMTEPDIYSGELNSERIKQYQDHAKLYNVQEGTIRDAFCRGADWALEIATICQSERDEELKLFKDLSAERFLEIERLKSELAELKKEREWVSVSERLPELDANFKYISIDCIFYAEGQTYSGYYDLKNGNWKSCSYNTTEETINVTHWQPLPTAP
jgi:hypothetical protein